MKNYQNSVDIKQVFSTLDWVVFFACLLITFAFVIYGEVLKKRKGFKTEKENFLDLLIMGRELTLPLFVATLVATWYGGIFGVTQIAFEKGVYNFLTQGVFWYATYIIFAFFIINKIAPYKAITLPDLVGMMFGKKSEKISAIFNVLNLIPISYAISLGLFLQFLFGGTLSNMILLGIVLVLCYSFYGGFRAVVFSDLIQFVIMCSGVLIVLIFSVYEFGGIDYLTSKLPSTHFDPMGGESLSSTLVWGFIALSTLVDPNFYQRCFAAQNYKVAKKGILISTLVWIAFDICTTAGALYARAVIPQTESGLAYLTYALQLLPDGLRGFVLAGILATILSTLDSYIFLAGTTIAYDLAPKKFKGKINFHHFGVISVGLLSVVLSSHFEGNIRLVWKTLGSYSAACLLLPIMVGYIWPKKISDNQFVFACLCGVVMTTYWRFSEWSSVIDELYIGIAATLTGLIIFPITRKLLSNSTPTA